MRVSTRFDIAKRARLLGVLVCLFTVPAVQAADGRIMFSGEIMAPTCAVAAIRLAQAVHAHALDRQHRDCPGKDGKRPGTPRVYRTTVTTLPGQMVDARVQAYFSQYVSGQGGENTLLATQTYQ